MENPGLVIVNYPSPVEIPEKRNHEGKFLQLDFQEQSYLLFASRDTHQYHNQILAHFLKEKNIPHHWDDSETLESNSPSLLVIGGGRFRANIDTHSLELWGSSQAYGRFNDNNIRFLISQANHRWSGYKVKIF